VAPHLPLGYFLRAEAEFALGKHRLAARSIEAGLRLKPEWPGVKTFRPRRDLYKGQEDEFDAHLRRLGDATQEQPSEGNLLFLYGYQLWFDGRPAEAAAYFERARAVAAAPTYIDRFLKDGSWKVASK
jgi:Tfp pilus assembly protein PilF